MLAETAYGKSKVRLVKVSRRGDRHDLLDLTVAIRFEGEYGASYTLGDNSHVLPTDTMKNTVYALAAKKDLAEPEALGASLADHFLAGNPSLQTVTITISEAPWGRITVAGREHGQAFVRGGQETRTCLIRGTRTGQTIGAGVADLVLMKTSHSAFTGFRRDAYTTLAETSDRLLATSMTARWTYASTDLAFGQTWHAVRSTLLETFAEHRSQSVQHTLHAMGQAVLDSMESVSRIRLVMPNKHHVPFDLTRLGLENRNEIFVPTDEPHGLIEATIVREE